MLEKHQPTVSVIIKALNEERHIAIAIESALASLADVDGEVILADGGSSDRTIEIARRYPITIVQLNNADDRSCGSGAQLGFQYSSGRYLFLMDGDMRLYDGFLPAAIQFLDDHPTVAGVGGAVIDCEIANLEFEQRSRRHDRDRNPGPVTRLNSCGLYRRRAVESIGYVTDRNLHGAEELDLAARLRAQGWTLARIDRLAVDHHGHTANAYYLLLRRMMTRNACATGEILRAALGRAHFWYVVGEDNNTLLCLLIAAWWMTIALVPFVLGGVYAAAVITGLVLLPFVTMSLRWRWVRLGLYSVAAWNVYALCFLPGVIRCRVAPARWLDSTILQQGTPTVRRSACEDERTATRVGTR
jgi:glycosyltransferase involved in cell wall biosynthesis